MPPPTHISNIMKCQLSTTRITSEKYPYLLRQISALPKFLDVAGKIPDDSNKFLCVVGTRANSNYGEEVCNKLIEGLKGYPIVIVSGLAIGIDSIAHRAALNTGLTTVSFPGSGLSLNAIAPASRRELAMQIIEAGGALISPFNTAQIGTKWTFPNRNRLMAGMSHATLVIEASKKSGTLITADFALALDRDLLVVPGSIFSDLSYGPHMLLRRGATPVSSSTDILQALGFPIVRKDGMDRALPNYAELNLTPEQKRIVDYLRIQALSATDLIEKTSLTSSKLNMIISELELLGLVAESGGNYKLA